MVSKIKFAKRCLENDFLRDICEGYYAMPCSECPFHKDSGEAACTNSIRKLWAKGVVADADQALRLIAALSKKEVPAKNDSDEPKFDPLSIGGYKYEIHKIYPENESAFGRCILGAVFYQDKWVATSWRLDGYSSHYRHTDLIPVRPDNRRFKTEAELVADAKRGEFESATFTEDSISVVKDDEVYAFFHKREHLDSPYKSEWLGIFTVKGD